MMRAAILLALMLPPAAHAGDPSGVDPAAIDQCLEAARTDGARQDCAGQQTAACVAFAETRYPDLHPVDRELACLDAEQQMWEARLTDRYDRLKAIETDRAHDRAAALVAMERAWIAFRDARCDYDRLTNGGGTGGALAQPQCLLAETARQVVLLESYLRDRGA